MYSWNTVRTLCAILLLLPLVHLIFLVSREMLDLLDSSPEVWSDEIAALDTIDHLDLLPEQPVVVVGGRLVKLWPGLEDLLAPRDVLVRGLGDATVNDIGHHYERLVGFYRPQFLVLLPGNSEFHIRDNKSPEELAGAIRDLAKLDLSHGYTERFYVFVPLKTVLHSGDYDKIDATHSLLAEWAGGNPHVTLLDANPLLADSRGEPSPNFFRSDGIHLNEHGFLRLSMLLREQLQRDESGPLLSQSR